MAENDVSEKLLEDWNDVFADIVNVLLFNGEEMVKEDELVNAQVTSVYKADGKLHEQERDISKYWKNSRFMLACIGIEDQTKVDRTMPLRVISYDGAEYRKQLLSKNKDFYPVVTIVLYFGKEKWKKRSLYDCIEIPEYMKPYVNDYWINVFEVAYLTDEQVSMFKSDFKIVADYFVKTRKDKDYVPSPDVIQHVDEVLKLLAVMTGDPDWAKNIPDGKGGTVTMCDVLRKEKEAGRVEGRAEGRAEGINSVAVNMSNAGIPVNVIMQTTGLSEEAIQTLLQGNPA